MENVWIYLPLMVTACLAGAINSVAGGGTLLTFPTLIFALAGFGDEAAAMANATSSVALLPGSIAGAWGYRPELVSQGRFIVKLLLPSLLGGLTGSLLLAWYPKEFEAVVPWLVLTAAGLFLLQPPLVRLVRRRQQEQQPPGLFLLIVLLGFQFLVAVYGGYFGAGIGILMLTALGFMGIGNIHAMNGIKTVLAAAINTVTVVVVIAYGLVYWPYVFVMAGAAILGGYGGARIARKLPAALVRGLVVTIGFWLGLHYLLR